MTPEERQEACRQQQELERLTKEYRERQERAAQVNVGGGDEERKRKPSTPPPLQSSPKTPRGGQDDALITTLN